MQLFIPNNSRLYLNVATDQLRSRAGIGNNLLQFPSARHLRIDRKNIRVAVLFSMPREDGMITITTIR